MKTPGFESNNRRFVALFEVEILGSNPTIVIFATFYKFKVPGSNSTFGIFLVSRVSIILQKLNFAIKTGVLHHCVIPMGETVQKTKANKDCF